MACSGETHVSFSELKMLGTNADLYRDDIDFKHLKSALKKFENHPGLLNLCDFTSNQKIVMEGYIDVKSSCASHFSTMKCYLFTDVLILGHEVHGRLELFQLIWLDRVDIHCSLSDPMVFYLHSPEVSRPIEFQLHTRNRYQRWLNRIGTYALLSRSLEERSRVGARHHIIYNTLHSMAVHGDLEGLEKVLQWDQLNLDRRDEDGWTALDLARAYHQNEVRDLILAAGATWEESIRDS
jgi:hypothetical protein